MTIPEDEWRTALDVLAAADEVALACHVGPDGDALGSMLALGLSLRSRGARVVASWGGEPFVVPRAYGFLPGQDLLVAPEGFPAAPDVLVSFDAGSPERLGTIEPIAGVARTLIVIDHHVTNDRFGTINLVDASAAASAVITYELLRRMDAPLDRDIATCLYVGLVTDTGRFQYANTTPHVHAIASDLLAHGVAQDEIARTIYDTHPVGYLRLAATALGRLAVDNGIAWTWITREDLAREGIGIDETDALIDLVRTADIADVAIVLKQQPDGRYRVSMRSKGDADVGALCESFGGGGHALAAGFTSVDGDPHGTVREIAAALGRAGG